MNGKATPEELAALIAHRLDYDRLAAAVAEHLTRSKPAGELVDAAELERRYPGKRARWWREHAELFGGIREGDGPRPRITFNTAYVERVLAERRFR